jgi:hypothetical protein
MEGQAHERFRMGGPQPERHAGRRQKSFSIGSPQQEQVTTWGGFWIVIGCRANWQGASGVEGDALPFGLGCGVAEAVVAHRKQAAGQDVAQVTLDELTAS